MKPKYLRMLINGKEIADMNAKLITLNVKNKKIMKIKVNILFTEQFHLMKDKEKKKMLEKDATIKSNNNSIKDDNNESNRIAMTNTKSKNKSEEIERLHSCWRKEGHIIGENYGGWTELYLIRGGRNLDVKETNLDVNTGAKKGEIKRAFAKMNKNKLKNRLLLSKFVDMVAA